MFLMPIHDCESVVFYFLTPDVSYIYPSLVKETSITRKKINLNIPKNNKKKQKKNKRKETSATEMCLLNWFMTRRDCVHVNVI